MWEDGSGIHMETHQVARTIINELQAVGAQPLTLVDGDHPKAMPEKAAHALVRQTAFSEGKMLKSGRDTKVSQDINKVVVNVDALLPANGKHRLEDLLREAEPIHWIEGAAGKLICEYPELLQAES